MKQENIFGELLSKELQEFVEKIVDKQVQISLESYKKIHKKYYHIKEVHHITGITVSALKQRKYRGTLKAVNSEGTILIPIEEVQRLINECNLQINLKNTTL